MQHKGRVVTLSPSLVPRPFEEGLGTRLVKSCPVEYNLPVCVYMAPTRVNYRTDCHSVLWLVPCQCSDSINRQWLSGQVHNLLLVEVSLVPRPFEEEVWVRFGFGFGYEARLKYVTEAFS